MRFLFPLLLLALLANFTNAQTPSQEKGTSSSSAVTATPGIASLGWNESAPATKDSATPGEDLDALVKSTELLQAQMAAAQGGKQPDEALKKQLDLLQKQLEVQQKMIKLLKEQMEKQPPAGAAVEKLQTKVATLENRTGQAAQRDQDLAQAVDNLNEHQDAVERNGPRLPATLKELFDPFRNNESPLSIYGTLVGGYELFPHQRGEGRFFFDALEPIILLQLNDHILLESELEFGNSEVHIGYAQADFIVNDWLTVVAGRYLAPVGYFNERLHPDWINKLPDFPLSERQVSLADFSLNGVQLRGGTYLCGSPLKMEYSLYVANGLGLPGTDLTTLADLGALKETTADVNNAIAWGSRVGFLVPECGINVGFSTFFNRPYGEDVGTDISLWGIDINYHKGNWDFRFEWTYMFEETSAFLDGNIHRRGMYAQLAYRPYDAPCKLLQNTEFVFRYSRERFKGIDPNNLDLTAFESPVAVPVNRDQYTFGINYYIAPSLIVRLAYEINREHGIDLHDSVLLGQLAWGF
jgi:hypothetical protein